MQVSEDEPGIDESNWYVSTSPVRDNKFLQVRLDGFGWLRMALDGFGWLLMAADGF